jgi:hypothetical protein
MSLRRRLLGVPAVTPGVVSLLRATTSTCGAACVAMLVGALVGPDLPAQTVGPGTHQPVVWDPQPWIDDLHEMRRTLTTSYANLQWLTDVRQVNLAALFDETDVRLRSAGSDADARAILDRLVRKIDDGHVELEWPSPAAAPQATTSGPVSETVFCRAAGFVARPGAASVAAGLPGYRALDTGETIPAGLVTIAGHRVGVVRLAVFMPDFSPVLCEDAVRTLRLPLEAPCADACRDSIEDLAYARMTALLEERVRRLKESGATILMVDVTNNGGGSEWAEAVARMLSGKPLLSERLGFVRGAHWVEHWESVATSLRSAAATASAEDKPQLIAWAAQADEAKRQAEQRCPASGDCEWLGHAGYATGLVGRATASAFTGKAWGPTVFSPAEFSYRDGVWNGPLVVVVDQGTFSAAEEFAAVLQDNHAAFLVGARTGGAGCGHTDGGTPTVLTHSRATLDVPDCARFRLDGSNEVNGVIPDYLLPWRANDGARFKAELLQGAMPEILRRMQTRDASSIRN